MEVLSGMLELLLVDLDVCLGVYILAKTHQLYNRDLYTSLYMNFYTNINDSK